MKSKILFILASLLLMVSCNSDYFTIKGELEGVGTQNIRVLYLTDDERVESEWVTVTDGRFEFTGSNYDWTIVYLIDNNKKIIARVAVKNGDDISIKGSLENIYGMTVEGTDENEQWSKFMNSNAKLYEQSDRKQLNAEIEKYVTDNPSEISSTLILLNDYSNISGMMSVDSLFKKISIDARPSGLVNNYYALSQQMDKEKSKRSINSLLMYSSLDSMITFSVSKHKANLLYFWNKDDANRKDVISSLKELQKRHEESGRLQIADVLLSSDSVRWKEYLEKDSTSWMHFWTVGGSLNRAISNLDINSSPYFIVANSLGRQLYRGNSLENAIKAVDTQMSKK